MIDSLSTVAVESTRFGSLKMSPTSLIDFPEGLVGFPKMKQFAVLPHSDGGLFYWFQSVQEAGFAFPVTDPRRFLSDYHVDLAPAALAPFPSSAKDDLLVFVMVSIPRECPQELWLNLQGPLIVHERSQLAKQLVLEASRYSLRHRVTLERTSDAASHEKKTTKHTHR